MLLGFGCVMMITLQAIVNIGVTTSLLPNKGMPLPFISFGGSNLAASYFMIGVLVSIHRFGKPWPKSHRRLLRRMRSSLPAMNPLRVVIAAGGQAGISFLGLAVAETLKERGHEVLLIVSEKEIDALALKAHPDFRAEKVPSIGMPSVLSPAFVRFLRRSWEGFSYCKSTYRKFRPSVVLGMGGFTSTAPILAGRQHKLATFIHEANAIPGRANKLTARFATRVLLAFAACAAHFPNRTVSSRAHRCDALWARLLSEKRRSPPSTLMRAGAPC